MRRFNRWVLDATAWLSLLVCLTTVVLWVRSYRQIDAVQWGTARLHRLAIGGGGFTLQAVDAVRRGGDWRTDLKPATDALAVYVQTPEPTPKLPAHAGGHWDWHAQPYTNWPAFAQRWAWLTFDRTFWPRPVAVTRRNGVSFDNVTYRAVEQWVIGRGIWVPFWLPCLALAALTAWRLRVWRRRGTPRRDGHCHRCAYDLTGNLSGVCPEMFSLL